MPKSKTTAQYVRAGGAISANRGADVNKSLLYRRLIRALLNDGFQLHAGVAASQDDLTIERDEILVAIEEGMAELMPRIPVISDHATIQPCLNAVCTWATIVCFKYILGQPEVIAVVEADRLADGELVDLAHRFDKIVIEMLAATARLDVGFRGVKLGSTGILLFVFFNSTSASHFTEKIRKKCKIFHFFKKTWVLPWVMDVPKMIVSSHPGLPLFKSVLLNRDRLQKETFQQI